LSSDWSAISFLCLDCVELMKFSFLSPLSIRCTLHSDHLHRIIVDAMGGGSLGYILSGTGGTESP
jgi:hypothetical protein